MSTTDTHMSPPFQHLETHTLPAESGIINISTCSLNNLKSRRLTICLLLLEKELTPFRLELLETLRAAPVRDWELVNPRIGFTGIDNSP